VLPNPRNACEVLQCTKWLIVCYSVYFSLIITAQFFTCAPSNILVLIFSHQFYVYSFLLTLLCHALCANVPFSNYSVTCKAWAFTSIDCGRCFKVTGGAHHGERGAQACNWAWGGAPISVQGQRPWWMVAKLKW